VQGQQQDKVKPDNYDDRPDRAAKAHAAHDRDLTEGDDQFSSMMSKIASPESMDASEALALIDDLMHQAGASYQEAVQQASVSYGIKPAKLNALYKQRESRDAFDGMFGGSNPASKLGIKEEQLDELSPKTLMSYSGKAQGDAKDRLTQVKAGAPNKKELISKAEKRVGGIRQAHSKVKDPEYGKKVVDEDWSNKYKRSIDCSNPKGFSQKAHCAGRKKNEDINEDIERYVEALTRAGYEVNEEKVRLDPKCWKGKKIGSPKTKMKGGVRVNNCVPVKEQGIPELQPPPEKQQQPSSLRKGLDVLGNIFTAGKLLQDPKALADQEIKNYLEPSRHNQSLIRRGFPGKEQDKEE
jgi:hypothetical protein